MKKLQVTLTIILILLYAFLAPIPQHTQVITPDLIIQPGDLYEALDMSLAAGDGRRVDFGPFGLSWEG